MFFFRSTHRHSLRRRVARHFEPVALETLVATKRRFPRACRVDLQASLESMLREKYPAEPCGFSEFQEMNPPTFTAILTNQFPPTLIAPLNYEEIDIGDMAPARCLKHALWLAEAGDLRFALLLTLTGRFEAREGVNVEMLVPPGEAAARFCEEFLRELERRVHGAGTLRGKVLSFEATDDYRGLHSEIKFHRLHPVRRDEVILPAPTLALLERNVHGFLRNRPGLRACGLPAKKGLLLYGPPGTGKTHTIRYLASELRDHTTLLVTSEQVALLDQYFQMARFLQPAILVIEDVDLIARARTQMRGACEESLLNKLLNEMDGLREDAEVLFILTTNRPDQIEAALAGRPGRIDQAIEFPLPDDAGRRALVGLYARGMSVPAPVVERIVARTDRVSAAFIKELMRRSAQFALEANGGPALTLSAAHVEFALEEMLLSGGSLNARLLGGAEALPSTADAIHDALPKLRA
ncbi:MAG: AAA family ATPase [Planctomycetota bacterium]